MFQIFYFLKIVFVEKYNMAHSIIDQEGFQKNSETQKLPGSTGTNATRSGYQIIEKLSFRAEFFFAAYFCKSIFQASSTSPDSNSCWAQRCK